MSNLPTAQELEKLPFRAIAAYAARAARRVQPVLRGVASEHLIEEALLIPEKVASTKQLDLMDPASAVFTASRVVREVVAVVGELHMEVAALAVESAVYTAYSVLSAALQPNRASVRATGAAKAAARAGRHSVLALDEPMATCAANAARRDYEILLKAFGEHDTIVVGEPIDLSDPSFLGGY